MPSISEIVSQGMQRIAALMPESVVTCGHYYTDETGTNKTQGFDAIESPLTARQQVGIFGTLANQTSELRVDLVTYPMATLPKSGDRITKRKGDGAQTRHVVLVDGSAIGAVLLLTIGPDNG